MFIIRHYTGIGSRKTPKEVLDLFVVLAEYLAKKGYVLRSGAAPGADSAFETGCDKANGLKEIYLPWANFENSKSPLVVKDEKAFKIAKYFHPHWKNLSYGAKKLHARNVHQVLGLNLKTPSDFIICWTKNGTGSGGTGQALRIARYYNIPVFDAGKYKDIEKTKAELRKFLLGL